MDAVFLAALFCGCVAALRGNRTAWALLASVAFTSGITLAGVPFHPVLWMMIDLMVILAILHPKMTLCDLAVIALFIPAWALYALMPPWAPDVVTLIVVAQFLMTFPVPILWGRCSQPVFRDGGPPDVLRMIYA